MHEKQPKSVVWPALTQVDLKSHAWNIVLVHRTDRHYKAQCTAYTQNT